MTQSVSISLYAVVSVAVALSTGAFLAQAHEGEHAPGEEHMQVMVEGEVESDVRMSPFRERLEALRANFDRRQEERLEAREEFRGNLETRKEQFEEHQDARRTNMEENRASMQSRLEERRAEMQGNITERLQGFVERMKERFMAAIERLEGIAVRIESRAEKLEAEGVDVEVTTEALAEARADLSEAKTLVNNLALQSTGTTTMRESFGGLRQSIGEIKEVLKSVHSHLRDAVMNLKGTSSINVSATSSSSATVEVE